MGKVLGIMLILSGVVAGAAMYYLQVYAFYEEITASDDDVVLTSLFSGEPEPILFDKFAGIDSDSSPIRYRACFETPTSLALMTETYVIVDEAEPLVAPGWFDCFDAEAIGAEISAGTALTFLAQKNIHFGVDRVVAITEDGRGYVWHELNDCGEKAYDGTIVGEECPRLDTE